MEKVDLTKQFSFRLRDAMIAAGFNSLRSPSGVDMNKLSEITGYSLQICRKYLRGEAIPEPTKLVEIAAKLKVSPGWLLFGESHNDLNSDEKTVTLSKNLLHYIFNKANCLYNDKKSSEEVAHFLMDLINDISHINASEEQTIKIINLALNSATHFADST